MNALYSALLKKCRAVYKEPGVYSVPVMTGDVKVGNALLEYWSNEWGAVFVRRLYNFMGVVMYFGKDGRELEYLRGLSGRKLQTAVKEHADEWRQGVTEIRMRIWYKGKSHELRRAFVVRIGTKIKVDVRWESPLYYAGGL